MTNQPPWGPQGQPPSGQHGPYPGGSHPSPNPTWPNQPPTPKQKPIQLTPRMLWITGGIVAAGLVIILIIVIASDGLGKSGTRDELGKSGTRDDWAAAVCRTGTFRNGDSVVPFRNADAKASCQAAIHPPESGNSTFFIGQWESKYLMQNDVAIFPRKYYAWREDDGTHTAFLLMASNDPAAIEPLKQFGFKIDQVPSR
jgi:hypothetical protein